MKHNHVYKQAFPRMLFGCLVGLFLSACAPAVTPTPFIAPYGPRMTPTIEPRQVSASPTFESTQPALETVTPAFILPTITQAAPATHTPQPNLPETEPTASVPTGSPTPRSCTDSMLYIQDLTYPDGSSVSPGQVIEKQWRIENNGSCDWLENYTLKLVDGNSALGAATEFPLVRAAAGSQATIIINFIAPLEAGTYQTAWQAYTPEGQPFGQSIFMLIIVTPQ